MSVIQGAEIVSLIDLFKKRGVKFYHACQYKDFKTYLQLGGVPSRHVMESSGLPYTLFDTDNIDKNNEVWNKVFGNLSDFGFPFAQGRRNENTAPAPNPYGPILLVFEPEVFHEVVDIGICLRSAGGRDFDRGAESLGSADEVNRIFEYSVEEAPNAYAKAYIKFAAALKKEFDAPQAMSPEVSCAVQSEKLSFKHLAKIIVDSYTIGGQNLIGKVRGLKQAHRLKSVVGDRRYSEGRREIKQELANLLLQQLMTLDEIIQNDQVSESLKDWAVRVTKGGISWQYDRFARYLRSGTILELNNEAC